MRYALETASRQILASLGFRFANNDRTLRERYKKMWIGAVKKKYFENIGPISMNFILAFFFWKIGIFYVTTYESSSAYLLKLSIFIKRLLEIQVEKHVRLIFVGKRRRDFCVLFEKIWAVAAKKTFKWLRSQKIPAKS